jgi:hypothetical protein
MTATTADLRERLVHLRARIEEGAFDDVLSEGEKWTYRMDLSLMNAALAGATPLETAERGWKLITEIAGKVTGE